MIVLLPQHHVARSTTAAKALSFVAAAGAQPLLILTSDLFRFFFRIGANLLNFTLMLLAEFERRFRVLVPHTTKTFLVLSPHANFCLFD